MIVDITNVGSSEEASYLLRSLSKERIMAVLVVDTNLEFRSPLPRIDLQTLIEEFKLIKTPRIDLTFLDSSNRCGPCGRLVKRAGQICKRCCRKRSNEHSK